MQVLQMQNFKKCLNLLRNRLLIVNHQNTNQFGNGFNQLQAAIESYKL